MKDCEILKLYRIANGYDTLTELSEATGISRSVLGRAEGGTRSITASTLRILSEVYDISLPAMVLSFRKLSEYNYDNKEERKKALAYILSLCIKQKNK